MKLKDARTLKLVQEVRYFKSVIANKTEIVSVLKSLPKFTATCPEIKKEDKEFACRFMFDSVLLAITP